MQLTLFNRQQRQSENRKQPKFAATLQSPSRITETARLTRAILPGQRGRLRYQATEWNAQAVNNSYIPAGAIVTLVTRRGNTWFVAFN
jgi:membrane protein implicated in regulation of membrane protease activity